MGDRAGILRGCPGVEPPLVSVASNSVFVSDGEEPDSSDMVPAGAMHCINTLYYIYFVLIARYLILNIKIFFATNVYSDPIYTCVLRNNFPVFAILS